MGSARITGLKVRVQAVPLRRTVAAGRPMTVLKGVCCVCLTRIGEDEGKISLHSRLWRHSRDECSPGSARYYRAIPRLRVLGEALQAEDRAKTALFGEG